jgi:hypothetical protein
MSKEFIWGETPAVFIGQLHHFLNCPAWYDELVTNPEHSMYKTIGMPIESTTEKVKKYQALDAIGRRMWRGHNLLFTIGHMAANRGRGSRVILVDGFSEYPYLVSWKEQMKLFYKELFQLEKCPIEVANGFSFVHAPTPKHVTDLVEKYQVELERGEQVVINLAEYELTNALPELEVYNKTWDAYRVEQQKKQQAAQQAAWTGQPERPQLTVVPSEGEELDQEQIDKMFDEMDTDGGGS